jgi:FkbM family methyltransferase
MADIGKIVQDDLGYKWIVRDDSDNEGTIQDMVGADLNHEKKYLDELIKFASLNSIFIDIGAHVGYYTIRLAEYFKKVLSIEPSLYNFKALKINAVLNEVHDKIKFGNIAIGNKSNEKVKLYERGSVSCIKDVLDLYNTNIEDKTIKSEYNVDIWKLDDAMSYKEIKDIGTNSHFVVKIDTEGMELDVLRGGFNFFNNYDSMLLVEHHNDKIKGAKNKIMKYLKKMGYFEILQKMSEGEDKMLVTNMEKYEKLIEEI